MVFFTTLGVRIAIMVAAWMAWGWWSSLLILLLLGLTKVKRTVWGKIDLKSAMVYVRVVIEIFVLIIGLYAINTVWGTPWAAALFTIYIIGMVVSK